MHRDALSSLPITLHASERMTSRRINSTAIELVMQYGQLHRTRKANIYVIGKKDVLFHAKRGTDLAAYEGIQVLCSANDDTVITVYRNKNLRTLRPQSRGKRFTR